MQILTKDTLLNNPVLADAFKDIFGSLPGEQEGTPTQATPQQQSTEQPAQG